jgi:adenosylcobinamide kinase / adenosylcobinamide-phosphate guanylyltransferase
MSCTLVLGGARSGKTLHAERIAIASGLEVVYIATARDGGDAEMTARIAHHRAARPGHWRTVEEPLALGAAIAHWRGEDRIVLVDCLTLWLTNLLFSGGAALPEVGMIELPQRFHEERAALLAVLNGGRGDVVLVSNEVGMGIVPLGAVSRCFVDEAGRLNQAVAAACSDVLFVAAGLPLRLKQSPC